MKMPRVLITGANGFIGSHLTDFLIDKNNEVYALDIPNRPFLNLERYLEKVHYEPEQKLEIFGEKIQIPTKKEKLKIIECDLLNAELLEKIILAVKPEYIFHLGAQSLINPSWENPAKTIQINVIGTINIFEPIKKNNIKSRIILACTSTQFGSTLKLNRALKEDDVQLPLHPYGISKLAAELLARQYYINFGIDALIVRFFNQTGPRKGVGAATDFTRKVALIDLGLIAPVIEVGNLEVYRDFMGIKDTLMALWLVATKGTSGEIYHICSNKKTYIKDLLNIALSFSNKEIKVKSNISSQLRKSDEEIVIGDNSKIKKELGFEISQPIDEVLRELYEYWRDYYTKYGYNGK